MRLPITAFIIFIFQTASADYSPMKLSDLICKADFGALGTIVKVDDDYFYLKVEKYVLNKLELDTLPIRKFKDWPCAQRYTKYETGQKEIVFFQKSNYVIGEFELLGYGAGDEFELPIINDSIIFQGGHGKVKKYKISDFNYALNDYNELKKALNSSYRALSKVEVLLFANKSNLHKEFINCKIQPLEKPIDFQSIGVMTNLERNYLYQDYENKIFVSSYNIDTINLFARNSTITKSANYFIVNPKKGWTRRWLNVYSKNNRGRLLANQIFEVIELPEPSIYFDNSIKDTINVHGYRNLIPKVGYYLDDMHKDDNLQYELLSYNYEIISLNNIKRSIKIKSEYGSKELLNKIKEIKDGDKITLTNIFVLYPNQTVKQIKDRTVVVRKE